MYKRFYQGIGMNEECPKQDPAIRTIAMPADTNPAGDIFGGWLMAQMDLAAGNMAARIARGRAATIAVEDIQFLRPVRVGDEVTLYADLESVGRTSMKINVVAWRGPEIVMRLKRSPRQALLL